MEVGANVGTVLGKIVGIVFGANEGLDGSDVGTILGFFVGFTTGDDIATHDDDPIADVLPKAQFIQLAAPYNEYCPALH
jgi:uncharacterized protein YcfJ